MYDINSRKLKEELLNNLFETMGKMSSMRYMPKKEQPEEDGEIEISIAASGDQAEDLEERVKKLKQQLQVRE